MKAKLKDLNDSFIEENKCIFKKYKPIKKIGRGGFGNIYSVIRLNDKSVFAMKTEKIKSEKKNMLESEAYYLFILQGFGIPKLISFGHSKKYNILIETLLDKSLYNLFIQKNIKFSIIDICLIGLQLLDRLEWIHSKNIIYRDVKPENFLIGIDDPNVIYVIDFGLCKKYRSSKTGKHILPKLTGKFNGNYKFCSPNIMKGKESSRRDDLISLGYILIYLIKKELPWGDNFKKMDNSNYFRITYLKDTNACGNLFKNIPPEFCEYIKYTRNLKFEQDPNYSYLRLLLNKVISNFNFNFKKLTFSWINCGNKKLLSIPKNNSKRKSSPQSRLFKKIKENQMKRVNSELLSSINLENNSYLLNKSNKLNIKNNEISINQERKHLKNNNNLKTINIDNHQRKKIILNKIKYLQTEGNYKTTTKKIILNSLNPKQPIYHNYNSPINIIKRNIDINPYSYKNKISIYNNKSYKKELFNNNIKLKNFSNNLLYKNNSTYRNNFLYFFFLYSKKIFII